MIRDFASDLIRGGDFITQNRLRFDCSSNVFSGGNSEFFGQPHKVAVEFVPTGSSVVDGLLPGSCWCRFGGIR